MIFKLRSPRDIGKTPWSGKILDWFFGYDYFLAHRSNDGKKYALALYDALTAKGNELDCFLDVKHYGAGRNLTLMQERALKKTTRLIVIVTPHAHDEDAKYLLGEVAAFRQQHPGGIIVPIGTRDTLSTERCSMSQLLPMLPHFPDSICVLEPEDWLSGDPKPSADAVAKLLSDFSEERRSTKRFRWIRRVALLLLIFLLAAIYEAYEANRELLVATSQRLATEANSFRESRPSFLELTTLLSAEACRLYPSVQASEALQQAVTLLPAPDHNLDHLHPIRSAVFSPDGTLCATLGEDGIIKVWKTTEGTRRGPDIPWTGAEGAVALNNRGDLALADGHTIHVKELDSMHEQVIQDPCPGSVYSVTLSVSGRYLCALSRENGPFPSSLCIWELKKAEPILKIRREGKGSVEPEDGIFNSTESDVGIKMMNAVPEIWKLDSGQKGEPLEGVPSSVESMTFSDDGRKFAAGDYVGIVQVWNVEDGKKIARMKCEGGWICTALAFNRDGSQLAAGSSDEVCIWAIPTGDQILYLPHGTVVTRVLYSQDNQYLLTYSQDGTLRVWKQGVEINRIALGKYGHHLSAYSNASGCFIACQNQNSPNQIQVWRLGQGDIFCQVEEGTGAGAAAMASSNQYIATVCPGDETLRVWKLNGGKCVKIFEKRPGGGKVAFSPKANYVATSSAGYTSSGDVGTATAAVYDTVTGKEITTIKHEIKVVGTGASLSSGFPEINITSLAFSPEGERLATASSEGTVKITHLQDGRKEFETKLKAAALMLTFTGPDQVTVVGADGNVATLSLTTGKLHIVTHFGTEETPLSITPDARFLATVGKDSQVRIWKLENSQIVFQFLSRTKNDIGAGKAVPIQAAGLSADGHYLAASQYMDDSRNVTIGVWDVGRHSEVASLVSEYPAAGISFSPDSKYLISAGGETIARIWQEDDLLQIAGERISHNFTPDEWSLLVGDIPYRKTFDQLP